MRPVVAAGKPGGIAMPNSEGYSVPLFELSFPNPKVAQNNLGIPCVLLS